MHISGGQPARGPEILSIRYRNSSKGEYRNIFIKDGSVVFIMRYYKGYHISGSVKVIYRYIPHAVGLLLVYSQWLVQPFQELIEAKV